MIKETMLKYRKKESDIYGKLLSFFIPIGVLVCIYVFKGFQPFGSNSALLGDMDHQYICFLANLRECLIHKGFFYSLSKTMGGNIMGINTYYLMSPLNVLFLFCSTSFMPYMIEIVSAIKIGLAGLFMYIYLSYENKDRYNIVFACAYALCSYNLFYLSNIMWFDNVYMLPLVVLGIKKLLKENNVKFYCFTLCYSIIVNYYIGFMICLFSVLFFTYLLVVWQEHKLKDKVKKFLQFLASSLLSGGMAMCVIIPAIMSVSSGNKSVLSIEKFVIAPNFYWDYVFVKLLNGSAQRLSDGLPNIYCSILVLVFVILFFLNRNIRIKNKVATLILLLIFFFSFYIAGINLFWHGMRTPIWFPYRYSFIFSFILLDIASQGQRTSLKNSLKQQLISMIVSAVILLAIIVKMYCINFEFMSIDKYAVNSIILLLSLVAVLFCQQKFYRFSWIVSLCLITVDLLINGLFLYQNLSHDNTTTTWANACSSYEEAVTVIEPAVNAVKEMDDGLYRTEKNFVRNINDPFLFGYNGLSHFSSSEESRVKEFMGCCGYATYPAWAYYNRGSSMAVDSLLGVKYLLSLTDLKYPYEYVTNVGDVKIYRNPYAFPIGFVVNNMRSDNNLQQDNCFEMQNEMFRNMYPDVNGELFIEENIENVSYINLHTIDQDNFYEITDSKQDAYIEYQVTATTNNKMYFYVSADYMKAADLYVNDVSTGLYLDAIQHDSVCLSDYTTIHSGDIVKIRLYLKEQNINVIKSWVYYLDESVFMKYYSCMAESEVNWQVHRDSCITGKCILKEDDSIMLTIPYDKGWHAYIDGERAESSVGNQVFLTINGVSAGEHEIKLLYVPRGLIMGWSATIISGLLATVWMTLRKRCKRYVNQSDA